MSLLNFEVKPSTVPEFLNLKLENPGKFEGFANSENFTNYTTFFVMKSFTDSGSFMLLTL